MPQPLSFIKLRDAEYVDQFAGSVVPELKDAQKVLNERYDLAEENDSIRAAIAREMMQNVAKKDETAARLAYDRAMGDIAANQARGDYENMYGKTANSARQFSVNAAKFIKEKQLMDAEWKRIQELKGVSDSYKQEIWDNNVMLANKPLTYNEKDNVVEGEHFKSVNIADDVDTPKILAGYAAQMKSDINAGNHSNYQYQTLDGKKATSDTPGAILFKKSYGNKWERVTQDDIRTMGDDIIASDPKFKDYENRWIQQKTGLKIQAVENDPSLTTAQKQVEKANLIKAAKDEIVNGQYTPAKNAMANIFGFDHITRASSVDFDNLGLLDAKSKAAAAITKQAVTGTEIPTEAVTNPNVVPEKDINPSKNYQSYVTDANGNALKTSTEVQNKISNALSVENLDKLPEGGPLGARLAQLHYYKRTGETEKYNKEKEKLTLELTEKALDVNETSWYEGVDKLVNSNTKSLLNAFGLTPVSYTQKEKEADTRIEVFSNQANTDIVKEEYAPYIEGRAGEVTSNALNAIEKSLTKKQKFKNEEVKQKAILDEYNRLGVEGRKNMSKVSLPAMVRSDDADKVLTEVISKNRDQYAWDINYKGETKHFNNFTALKDFLIEEGLQKKEEPINEASFKAANAKLISPLGDSADLTTSFNTSEGNTITAYTKGDTDLRSVSSGINYIWANSILKGKDTYRNPKNPGRAILANKKEIEFITETANNPNWVSGKEGSLPYITDVYTRPAGSNRKFVRTPLSEYTNFEKSLIAQRLSDKNVNLNSSIKKESDQMLNYEIFNTSSTPQVSEKTED